MLPWPLVWINRRNACSTVARFVRAPLRRMACRIRRSSMSMLVLMVAPLCVRIADSCVSVNNSSESLIAPSLPRGDRQFSRHYFSDTLGEPFQMESYTGALFVLLLLQPSGLFRQQLAKVQIRFAQSIDLGRFDAIAD